MWLMSHCGHDRPLIYADNHKIYYFFITLELVLAEPELESSVPRYVPVYGFLGIYNNKIFIRVV